MNRFIHTFSLSVIAAILCGCEPEERFAWSPDGERAVVLWESRLLLVDEDGKILAEQAEEDQLGLAHFDWLPDGQQLVVHREREVSRWEDARPLLSKSEVTEVERLGRSLPELIRAAAAAFPDDGDFETGLSRLALNEALLFAAYGFAWESDPESIRAALASIPSESEPIEEPEVGEPILLLHELAVLKLNADRSGFEGYEVFSRSIRDCHSLAVSPDGSRVAVGRPTKDTGWSDDVERVDLEVIDLDDHGQREVALKIAPAFDWALDSRSLVYLKRLSGKSGKLMRLQCLAIPEIEDETDAEPARDLALVFVPFAPRVAVLPDGDVLFAGQPLTLPIRGGKPPGQPRLFTVPVEGGEILEVPTKPGVLPMDLGYFVPSPDGSRVAVVESGSDAVAVIDLASGESELVSPPHPFWNCRTLPAWKNPDALSYAAFEKEDSPLAWKLWQRDREPRQLSADWPLEVTSEWLENDAPKKE